MLAVLALAGCGGGGAITVPRPVGLVSASRDSAEAWSKATTPAETREIRFRWQF